MKEYSISTVIGDATIAHNIRLGKTRNKNVDRTKEKENLIFETIYNEARTQRQIEKRKIDFLKNINWLSEEIERYNTGKKPSRKTSIEKELSKSHYNQNTRQYENRMKEKQIIIQIGNMDHNPKDYGDEKAINEAYKRVYEAFKKIPGIYITDARVHNDETTPHLNICFYTIDRKEQKQGLQIDLSTNNWINKHFGDFKTFRNGIIETTKRAAARENIKAEYKANPKHPARINDIEEWKQIQIENDLKTRDWEEQWLQKMNNR